MLSYFQSYYVRVFPSRDSKKSIYDTLIYFRMIFILFLWGSFF